MATLGRYIDMEMVSVIIPVYNRAHLVGRTLMSVLAQTARPLEVVLIDNNSTDASPQVLQDFQRQHSGPDFRVIVDGEPLPGAARARNRGAQLSSGKWLLFFDSDDTMEPDTIERFLETAHSCPGTEMVIGRADQTDLDGHKHERHFYTADLLANNIFHACLCPMHRLLLSRQLCCRAGWWPAHLATWDDWEYTTRLLLARPVIAFCDQAVTVHVYAQRQSITGTDFASKAGTWEQAIDDVERLISNAHDLPHRQRLLMYVEYRRIALAGAYIAEHRRDLAIPLTQKANARVQRHRVARWLYPLLRSYVAAGGRGASHLVKRWVK